eukprot:78867_1
MLGRCNVSQSFKPPFMITINRQYRTRKYQLNENFLDNGLTSHEHAWFWGWFLTDGGIVKNQMSWDLKYNSYPALEKLRNIMNATYPIHFSARKDNTYQARLTVTSQQLCQKAIELMRCPPHRKTFDLQFPHMIDAIYMPSLIRAIVDGDGSWAFHYGQGKINAQITSANKQFLEDIRYVINSNCLNTSTIYGQIYALNPCKKAYDLRFYRPQTCNEIGKWIYPDEIVNSHIYANYRLERFKLFQKIFINEGVLKPDNRIEKIRQFKRNEIQNETDCLNKLILMSKGEIESPPHFHFAPSWYKHFGI